MTSTPVIDRTRGSNGAVYVVAMSKDSRHYLQRVHALDLALGTKLFGGPVDVQATYPGTGDKPTAPTYLRPRAIRGARRTLLLNGIIYTWWTSHCDIRPYTGWIIAYNAGDAGADQRAECHPERQRRRHLDGRRRTGGR